MSTKRPTGCREGAAPPPLAHRGAPASWRPSPIPPREGAPSARLQGAVELPVHPDTAARAFYDFAPHVCLVLDADGVVLSVNARGAEALGTTPAELAGVPVSTLLAPDSQLVAAAHAAEALARPGRLLCAELCLMERGSRRLRVRQELVAVPAPGGRCVLLAVWVDVTGEHGARRALEVEQARVQALTLESTLVEERERRRLSVALHDEVGQRLALARLALVRERTIGGGGQRAADGLLELIDEAIAATRALTADLSSPVLYELGLEAALRSLCDRTAATLGLTVRFTVVGEARALPEGADVVLFRAARELVHNAVKHAHASRVEVELRWTADGVSLRVGDDGLGFREQDPASGATPRGFGLLSLRQQVRALGGAMDVESTPGAGTAVEVRVSC